MAKLLNGDRNAYEIPGQDEIPESDRVRFYFRTPTVYDRAKMNRAVAAQNCVMHGTGVLYARAREVLAEIYSDGETDRLVLEEILTRLEADDKSQILAGDLEHYKRLEDELIRHDRIYAGYCSDRSHYLEVAPIEGFRLFCTGWDNIEPAYRKGFEGVHLDVINALTLVPGNAVTMAGFHAMSLMRPSEPEAKNSDSLSGGDSDRAVSEAAKEQPETDRSDPETPRAA